MKRTAIILLTTIYLLSCLGIGINRFYCCGKLASVKITYAAADNTTGKTAGQKNNCCKNETESLKIKDTHISSDSFIASHPLPAIIVSIFTLDDEIAATLLDTNVFYKGNAPPGHPDVPVYTLNCTYRI